MVHSVCHCFQGRMLHWYTSYLVTNQINGRKRRQPPRPCKGTQLFASSRSQLTCGLAQCQRYRHSDITESHLMKPNHKQTRCSQSRLTVDRDGSSPFGTRSACESPTGEPLITLGRLDAVLHDIPLERTQHTIGRPHVAGKRLPSLEHVTHNTKTVWQRVTLNWYR